MIFFYFNFIIIINILYQPLLDVHEQVAFQSPGSRVLVIACDPFRRRQSEQSTDIVRVRLYTSPTTSTMIKYIVLKSYFYLFVNLKYICTYKQC